MNEAVLQGLLILAFLAIGLISVTFPIYAIAVNFLPQQKWEGEKDRKRRMDELRRKISRITNELGGKDIDAGHLNNLREQLDKYESELEGTELRVQYLTAKGAVIVPVVSLLLSLILSVTGAYAFYRDVREWAVGLGIFSGLCSIFALYRLCKTISAVEYGALRPERTVEFDIGFVPELLGKEPHAFETYTTPVGKQTPLEIGAKTSDYDLENFFMRIRIPKELKVTAKIRGENLTSSEYEDVTIIDMRRDFLAKGEGIAIVCPVIPSKAGKHLVFVRVCAKGIYDFEKTLFVDAV